MPTDYQQELHAHLQTAFASGDTSQVAEVLAEAHAADLAEVFIDLDEDEQEAVLAILSDEQAAELLDELDPGDRDDVLDMLSVERTSDILDEMPSDDAADLLADLPTEEANALMERMEPEQVEEIADLLRYAEDTAGGLMAKEFINVTPDQTVREVMDLLRHQDEAEMIYYVYVLDEEERLLGIVTLRKLIVADPAAELSDIMTREFVSVPTDMPQEEVAEVVRRHDLLAVPVLDEEGRMQGIVTVDDIGDVVQEEAAEDLLEISGTEEQEETPQPRVRWRGWRSGMLALAGGILSAIVLWLSSRALTDWIHVAAMLPLLLILGITAASQAALAMDHAYDTAVERYRLMHIFAREMLAGAALALVSGLLAGAFIFAVARSAKLAVAVAVPIAVSLWAISAIGALGSILLRRSGGRLGPASHTVVVVVALLIGISIYLLMASLLAVPVLPQPR